MTTTPHSARLSIGPYRLRGLSCTRSGPDDDAWAATLLRDDRRIARLKSSSRHGPIQVHFLLPVDRLRTIGFAIRRKYGEIEAVINALSEEQCQQAFEELLLTLAERAYHERQLQVQSLKHTLFRLVGDPPDRYRTVRNGPYTLEREGQLRLIYGQRLVEIVHRISLLGRLSVAA